MRSNILVLLVLLMLSGISPLIAQVDITGSITDGATGDPLIGASVIQKGTTNGTTADASGSFTLTVESLPTEVIFSFVGYKTQVKEITSTQPLQIVLNEDAELVGEVVVVGYGRQKKRVSTGSIAKVTAKDIEGIPVPDAISTLEGQTAGLIVNESSGQPGAGKSILVRGISTNGDNSPLFIVDGLQLGNIDNI
ncbi:MAG: carboxypeptidase-like regulatory domain-containing protein, partial [Flavobacteriales bacterium]